MAKVIKEQISLFDIELPPINEIQNIPENTLKQSTEQSTNSTIKFSKVPDEEFNYKLVENVPKVADILKTIQKGVYKVGIHDLLSDVFECGAIAISNQFDLPQAPQREERYLQIMNKHDKDTQCLIAELFTQIYTLLTNQMNPCIGFNDYLGDLYMKSETSNKKAGQFFTPYSVSKMCAEAVIFDDVVNEHIEQDKILTLNEPACGSSGMIIGAVDVLYNKYHFNYSRNLLVECSDIDKRCVCMTYLQLALSGVPAIIYHRDTISMQTWERWETPAYIMQWLRFKDVFEEKR